jgi:hypothetical protein
MITLQTLVTHDTTHVHHQQEMIAVQTH